MSFPELIKLISRGFCGKIAEIALTVNKDANKFSRSNGMKFSRISSISNASYQHNCPDPRRTFFSCITDKIFNDLLAESTQASIKAHADELTF